MYHHSVFLKIPGEMLKLWDSSENSQVDDSFTEAFNLYSDIADNSEIRL